MLEAFFLASVKLITQKFYCDKLQQVREMGNMFVLKTADKAVLTGNMEHCYVNVKLGNMIPKFNFKV